MKKRSFWRLSVDNARTLAVWLAMGATSALAQKHPFAVGPREVSSSGVWGWIAEQQAYFYKILTGAVSSAMVSPAAFWSLAGLCFIYGALHAAGPGHGKAVISAYLVANESLLRRAIAMTFAAALLQAFVAVAIVGIGVLALRSTARQMTQASEIVEIVSYGVIIALGLTLVWRKGRALLRKIRTENSSQAVVSSSLGATGITCEAVEEDAQEICADCGQSHAPDPEKITDQANWKDMAAAVASAGARPCSGAILVLVFTFAQGAYWLGLGAALAMAFGVAATTSALAAIAMLAKKSAARILKNSSGALVLGVGEFLAALLVLAFGLALLIAALKTGAGGA